MGRYQKGYFVVPREAFTEEVMKKPEAIALLCTLYKWANEESSEIQGDEGKIQLHPGQLVTSLEELSSVIKVSTPTVRKLLVETFDGLLLVKTSRRGTMITLRNYVSLPRAFDTKEKSEFVIKSDESSHSDYILLQLESINTKGPSFEEKIEKIYTEKYPRKEGKQRGLKTLKSKIKAEETLVKFDKAVEYYSSLVTGKSREYIKQFSTFANCWEDYYELWVKDNEEKKKLEENPDFVDLRNFLCNEIGLNGSISGRIPDLFRHFGSYDSFCDWWEGFRVGKVSQIEDPQQRQKYIIASLKNEAGLS